MSAFKEAQARKGTTVRIVTALYSILFIGIIAVGYYLLLQKNPFIAGVAALVLAFLAWNTARFVGSEENGIRRHAPLFILLLIISAVGIFNSLMLNLEGKRIFQEAVAASEESILKLGSVASTTMRNPKVEQHLAKVAALSELLYKEIRNPLACGQGPVALQIMADIRGELPAFQPLASKGIDCSKNERLEAAYRDTISRLVPEAPWYREARYAEMLRSRDAILEFVSSANKRLGEIRVDVNHGFPATLISSVAPKLEELGAGYRDAVQTLAGYVPDHGLPTTLNLSSIQNLGEWSQLINLLLSRLDKPSTYIYLALAVFADWMMVYLFSTSRRYRAAHSGTREAVVAVDRPW